MKKLIIGYFNSLKKDIFKHKVSYLILFLALVVGGYARFHHIVDYAVFSFDQGRDMLVVWDIVYNHNPTLIGPVTGLQGVFLGPFYYYLTAIPFILSGGHPMSSAIFIDLVGLLTIPISYLIILKLFNRTTATIAAMIVAISPFLVFYSRFAWNPNILPPIALVFYFCLVRVCQGRVKFVYLGTLALALALQTEAASAFFYFPTIILAFLIYRPKVKIKSLIYCGIILISSISPIILFELRNHFLISKNLAKFFTGRQNNYLITTQSFGQRRTLLGDVFSNTFYFKTVRVGVVFVWLSLIFSAIKILGNTRNEKEIPLKIAFLWMVINLTGLVFFYPGIIFEHFLFSMIVVMVILGSYFLSTLYEKYNVWGKATVIVFLLLMFLSITQTLNLLKTPEEDTSRRVSYLDQLAAIFYIYNDSKGQSFALNVYTPPAIDYSFQYLVKWYAKSHNLPVPQAPSRLTYLILEPKPSVPSQESVTSFDRWYMEAKASGVLVDRVNVSGGLIIEKRVK